MYLIERRNTHLNRPRDISKCAARLARMRNARVVDQHIETTDLLPLLLREIVYRLLIGKQGVQLRQIAFASSFSHPVLRAVEWINRNFAKPIVIQSLAREAGMSPSSLHRHFKAVTALTPLQYQRQIRLHEAQRPMVKEELDAANAAYRVGYGDASHFSRDYRRFFGYSPRFHAESLRKNSAPFVAAPPM